MFKFITHRNLLVNILFGIFLILLFILGFFFTLGWITDHGKTETVPNVTGKNIEAARLLLESKGFVVEVVDSIFDISQPRLSVMKQTPDAEAIVKKGRTIFLTVNRLVTPKIDMPNLVGLSLKSALIYLESAGLKLGDTTFKPDIARNAILAQTFNGTDVKPGTKVPLGSFINLVVGSGLGSEDTDVPNLVGLTYSDAKSLLGNMNISIGLPILIDAVTDTAHAFVVRQDPPVYIEPVPGQKFYNRIRAGQIVDIWLSVNPPKDSTQQATNDTTYQP